MFFALEYRDEEVHLQYREEPLRLAENLVVLGTVNTADRGIAQIDARHCGDVSISSRCTQTGSRLKVFYTATFARITTVLPWWFGCPAWWIERIRSSWTKDFGTP